MRQQPCRLPHKIRSQFANLVDRKVFADCSGAPVGTLRPIINASTRLAHACPSLHRSTPFVAHQTRVQQHNDLSKHFTQGDKVGVPSSLLLVSVVCSLVNTHRMLAPTTLRSNG
jgi:hypothetical protein